MALAGASGPFPCPPTPKPQHTSEATAAARARWPAIATCTTKCSTTWPSSPVLPRRSPGSACRGSSSSSVPTTRDGGASISRGSRPSEVLASERIRPVSRHVRERLIDHYCPAKIREEVRADGRSRCCLVRLYLGRERAMPPRVADVPSGRPRPFGLRNFPLYVDQAEDLGLGYDDVAQHAATMAETLAVVHWLVGADAGDVEFVLAAPRRQPDDEAREVDRMACGCDEKARAFGEDSELKDHVLWMLDFDLCKPMGWDGAGVAQAVDAFFLNDPYYPRPGRALWEKFRGVYLSTSRRILVERQGQAFEALPNLFIEQLEHRQAVREAQRKEWSGKLPYLWHRGLLMA